MKIHLGCGTRVIPGFVHVDLVAHPHVAVVADARRLDAFEDGVACLVYASHLLEHVPRAEVRATLDEWRRVLKPGGTLRLSVPNFEAWCRLYSRVGRLSAVEGSIVGGQKNAHDFHRSLFDYGTLKTALEEVGFDNVRWWDWRKTEHAGVDDYSQAYWPHMDKENGVLMSLNLEADKRGSS